MAEHLRIRGRVKNPGMEELRLTPASQIVKKARKAGELPGFVQKFDVLWKSFPNSMRDKNDRRMAINRMSELGIGEFVEMLEGFMKWNAVWRAMPERDRKYIPRLHNWIDRGDFRIDPATRYKFGTAARGVITEAEALPKFITVKKEYALSDCQTGEKYSSEVRAVLGDDGQYRIDDDQKARGTKRVVASNAKSPLAPINNPMDDATLGELQELAAKLRKDAEQ